MQYNAQIVVIMANVIFAFFLFIIYQKMKREFHSFNWNSYCKQCDIYRGKSHWKIITQFSYRIVNQVKRKTS